VVPEWFVARLGWKEAKSTKPIKRCTEEFGRPYGPNLADLAGPSSTLISGEIYRLLGIPYDRTTDFDLGELEQDADPADGLESGGTKQAEGTVLELGLESDLRSALTQAEPARGWHVTRTEPAHQFAQFAHMRELERVLRDDAVLAALSDFPELVSAIARDYNVKSDVMIGLPNPSRRGPAHVLHAAVSSKLTLRSDRAQNVRTEFGVLVRNRRGRLPHLVVVTAEPLPSRLVSLTRGTGEIDANYHLLFEELDESISNLLRQTNRPKRTISALSEQARTWREMVDGGRMRPYSELAETLRQS
jgi:hypothetical protein